MSVTRVTTRRQVRVGIAVAATAGTVLGVAGTATATTGNADTTRHTATAPSAAHHWGGHHASYTMRSAPLAHGLYQSAYSERNHVLWATTAVGRPPVTESRLLKVSPGSLTVRDSYTPPVTDKETGAVEAVYGVAVDDRHNTVWTTNSRDDSVAVYSQRTGRHLASLPNVEHARAVAVDARRNLAWATGFGDGSVVAFDTKTFKEKKRVTVEGAGPGGLAVNERTGTVYATDLTGGQLIKVTRGSDKPELIPAGEGAIDVSLSRDGRTAYTANQKAGTVSVVNLRKGEVTREIPTGEGSLSVATDERTGRVLVANRDSDTTTVVDPRRGKAIADLPTGAKPNHVTVVRGTAFVVDKASASEDAGEDALDSVHRVRTRR